MKGIILSSLMLVACTQQMPSKDKTGEGTGNSTNSRSNGGQSSQIRICDYTLAGATSSRLASFFGVVVRNVEGPPTACLAISGSGTDISTSFRVEYEDDFGVRAYETDEDFNFYGKLEQVEENGQDVVRLEQIFIDDYGLIEIRGEAIGNNALMTASIRFHNFPSYEEALEQALNEARTKCRDGTWTVAQCLGYNWPSQFWWNQPNPQTPSQQMLTLAREILADNTKSRALGSIQFDLSDVLNQ
jgi:hypothetical protein